MGGDGPFGSLCMNHTLTCCLNGGGRKAVWETRVRHAKNDATAVIRSHKGRRKPTSSTNVSASPVGDPSLRASLRCVGLGGGGRESWDGFVVECPVAVVGAVDASSEDSEMVDSSKLTPAMAGFISQHGYRQGIERAERCSDRENIFLELVPWGQQTLGV